LRARLWGKEERLRIRRATAVAAALFGFAAFLVTPARLAAQEPLVLRAGPVKSAGYRLARELTTALAASPRAPLKLRVVGSSGAGADAADAVAHPEAAMFLSEPGWVHAALRAPTPASSPRGRIYALFPFPFLSLHWVVRADRGIGTLAALAGHRFIAGKPGTFTAEQTAAALALEIPGKTIRPAASAAEPAQQAFARNDVAGFAEAAAFPAPDIRTLAKTVPLRLLSVSRDTLAKLIERTDGLSAMVIPASTYPGVGTDTVTLALPLGVYATTAMPEAEAYAITKAFWLERPALAARDPRWAAVTPEALSALGARLHPGALRYYAQRGIAAAADKD
jgi:TRAP transporter TAXI family solute receptor